MKPKEVTAQGFSLFGLGVILGGGAGAGGGAFAIYLVQSRFEQLREYVYFAASLLFCLMGIILILVGIFEALKYWHAGRRWREQGTTTVTIQGTFADWWIQDGLHNKTLVKIQRKDGSSKMLLIAKELDELLPEIGEGVEIDYLFGCEAVVAVRSLAGAAGTAPAEDQPAES